MVGWHHRFNGHESEQTQGDGGGQCMKVKSENEVAQSCLTLSESEPTRLLRPWDFPGKSTGVGCHCLLRWLRLGLSQIRIKGHLRNKALHR